MRFGSLALLVGLGLPSSPAHSLDEPADDTPHLGTTRRRLAEAVAARDTGGLVLAARDCVRLGEKGLHPLWDALVALCTEEVGPRPARPRPNRLEEEDALLRSLEEAFVGADRDTVRNFLADTDLAVRSSRRVEMHLAWSRLVARAEHPLVGYHRQRIFTGDGDWRARVAAAELLSERTGSTLPESLLRATDDPSWPVRRIALEAIVRTRCQTALPRLIRLLDEPDSPGREDVYDALRAVTRRKFGDRKDLWLRWWRGEVGVPEPGTATPASSGAIGPVTGSAATGFFGLPIRSRLALFVLDVSGSMADSPRRLTRSATGEALRTKWDIVRAELRRALQDLPEGASFGLVVYEEGVHAWRSTMTPVTDQAVAEALAFASGFRPGGGTDLLGALEYAFDFAVTTGDGRTGPGVDTVFLLSDGLPTLGALVLPEDLLAEVDRRNRLLRLRIHTIAAGEHDRSFLTSLATRNGGIAVDLLPERP